MGSNEAALLSGIAEKANSELLLFIIVIIVAMVIFFLPLYSLMLKDRKAKNEQENERLAHIIRVVTANTEVMTELKAALVSSGNATTSSLRRVHTRLTEHGRSISRIAASQSVIEETLDSISARM